LLPEDYVPDVHLRLMLYKRIAGAASHDDLREMQVEMIDRFGLLPAAGKNFMRIAAIKLEASGLGIEKIDAAQSGGYMVFGKQTHVDPVALVQLVQNDSQTYRMQGAERLQFRLEMSDDNDRFTFVEQLLQKLASKTSAVRRMAG
jgi:transcription-repair coupling factor (superfamily II helicase)